MRAVKPPQRVMQIKWNHSCKMLSKTHQDWPHSKDSIQLLLLLHRDIRTQVNPSAMWGIPLNPTIAFYATWLSFQRGWGKQLMYQPVLGRKREPRNRIPFLPALFSSWRLPLSFSQCSCFHLVLNCSSPAVWEPLMYTECLQRQWKCQDPTDWSSNPHSFTSIPCNSE